MVNRWNGEREGERDVICPFILSLSLPRQLARLAGGGLAQVLNPGNKGNKV